MRALKRSIYHMTLNMFLEYYGTLVSLLTEWALYDAINGVMRLDMHCQRRGGL